MRRKEPPKTRKDGQVKLRIQSHQQSIKSNRIIVQVKVILLMYHIHLMDRLLHNIASILVMYHWIIVGCAQSYYIQYPSIYPSCTSQKPVSDNLIKKDFKYSKKGEKNMKQDSKYLKLTWCPSDLSHTQKRRLQRMRKKDSMEQQAEIVPAKSATMKPVWRPKQVVSSSA